MYIYIYTYYLYTNVPLWRLNSMIFPYLHQSGHRMTCQEPHLLEAQRDLRQCQTWPATSMTWDYVTIYRRIGIGDRHDPNLQVVFWGPKQDILPLLA